MANLNRVMVMGHLGRDPELRYTQGRQAVVNMSIATTEHFEKDGQKHEKTEWHNTVAWGRQAEAAAKYLKKGSAVFVEGKLQTRKWQDKEGKDRYTTEIVAQTVQFLGSPNQQGQGHPAQQPSQPSQPGYPDSPGMDQVPF